MIQFWSLMDEILNAAQSKRLMGIIGSAGIAGGVFAGLLVQSLVRVVGTNNLVLMYAGFMGLIMIPVTIISKREKESLLESYRNRETHSGLSRRQKLNQSKRKKESNRYLSLVVGMVSIITIVSILIDYQFKNILQKNFHGSAMAEFLGQFYIYSGIAALIFQLLLSSKILTRYGILISLIIMPFSLFLSSGYIALIPYLMAGVKTALLTSMPMLIGVTIGRFNDRLFSDTIYAAANQLLYIPFTSDMRKKAKVLIGAIVKPASKGFIALALIASIYYFPVELTTLSSVSVVLLLISFVLIFKIKKEYGKLLISSLDTKNLNLEDQEIDLNDKSTLSILYTALKSDDEREVMYAIEALTESENNILLIHMTELLDHPSAYVRWRALGKLETMIPVYFVEAKEDTSEFSTENNFKEKILHLLKDSNPEVKGQAIITLASFSNLEDMNLIVPFLEHADAKLRGSSIIGLIRYFGIDGMYHGLDAFRKILHNTDKLERIEAARIIGHVGISNFHRPLLELLNDSSIEVCKEAVNAAGKVNASELIPLLIKNLGKPEIKRDVIGALSSYPEALIVPPLESLLTKALVKNWSQEHDENEKNIIFSIPRVLMAIGTERCARVLFDRYESGNDHLKSKILEAMIHMNERNALAIKPEKIESLVIHELKCYREFQIYIEKIQGYIELEDVRSALIRARYHAGERIFQLLSFVYDPISISKIKENIFKSNPVAVANAMEALDNLLKGEMRKKVIFNFSHLTLPDESHPHTSDYIFTILESLIHMDYDWIQKVSLFTFLNLPEFFQKKDIYKQIFENIQTMNIYKEKEKIQEQIQKVHLLSHVPLFSDLPGETLLRMAEKTGLLKLPSNHNIFSKGDIGNSMYIVVSGNILIHDGDKKLKILEYGNNFGEMSLLDSETRSASATTLEPTELLHLDSKTFYSMVSSKMEIAMGVIRSLNHLHRNILASLNPENNAADSVSESEKVKAGSVSKIIESHSEPDIQSDGRDLLNPDLVSRILTLRKIELFSGLDDRDLALVGSILEEEFYESGEDIVREGEAGNSMYIIGKGSVLVQKKGQIISVLKQNDYFGEMSLIDKEQRSATVTTIEKTIVWKITEFEFYNLLSDKTSIIKNMAVVLTRRIRNGQTLLRLQEELAEVII